MFFFEICKIIGFFLYLFIVDDDWLFGDVLGVMIVYIFVNIYDFKL